jgi:SAM-dependent methyltransferase
MTDTRRSGRFPDRAAALEQYRRRAPVYDLELALFEPVRRRAIDRLALRRGETVIDVGCGTGLSLPLLRQAVGPRGRVIGIEQSPDMIEHARGRVAQHKWKNVTLICSPVETAAIEVTADAALFHFTHDILRRADAVANVVRHLAPGARLVASGLKWAPRRAWPVNLLVWPAALRSVTSLEGLHAPWNRLGRLTTTLEIEPMLLGAVYVARGGLAP